MLQYGHFSHLQAHLLCICLMAMLMMIVRSKESRCPVLCQCVSVMMDCKTPGLFELPRAPSDKLKVVVISNQTFLRKTLDGKALMPYWAPSFGGMVELKLLKIRYCNIVSLAPGTFTKLGSQLEEIDLSGNPLFIIGAHVFSGLRLKSIFLNDLPNPRFDENSFSEAIEVNSLSLHNSKLTNLPYHAIHGLVYSSTLKHLIITGNKLTRLDHHFEDLFKLLQTFELFDNQWHCDCNLRWLIQRYQISRIIPSNTIMSSTSRNSLSDFKHPACVSPNQYAGLTFDQIVLHELTSYSKPFPSNALLCELPRLDHIEVDLRQHPMSTSLSNNNNFKGQIACRISGSPNLFISWIYHPETGQVRNLTSFSKLDNIDMFIKNTNLEKYNTLNHINKVRSSLSINRIANYDMYTCIGSNALGNVSATVNIRWPLYEPVKIDSKNLLHTDHQSAGEKESKNVNGLSAILSSVQMNEQSILNKRFSLMDVIGAVVGTFLATTLIFVLAYRSSKTCTCRNNMFKRGPIADDSSKPSPNGTSLSGAVSLFPKSSNPADNLDKQMDFFDNERNTNTQLNKNLFRQSLYQVPSRQNQFLGHGLDDLAVNSTNNFIPKLRDSGTFNSQSTASSVTANGHGAYETVYNDPSHLVYDTPMETMHNEGQPFSFSRSGQHNMVRYPLTFSGTLPKRPVNTVGGQLLPGISTQQQQQVYIPQLTADQFSQFSGNQPSGANFILIQQNEHKISAANSIVPRCTFLPIPNKNS